MSETRGVGVSMKLLYPHLVHETVVGKLYVDCTMVQQFSDIVKGAAYTSY